SGSITIGAFKMGSNKTIVGASGAKITGDLQIFDASNVIIRNVTFQNTAGDGDGDCITMQRSHNYFITHCSFLQSPYGSLDQTHACDYGTISWCKWTYPSDTGHNFVNLIGHSDSNASEDTGHLRITMHHNWYGNLCVERMPRVRFGKVHVYNNYYGSP